jgi:hypothetical protein
MFNRILFVRTMFVRTMFVRTMFVRTMFVRTMFVRTMFVRTMFCESEVGCIVSASCVCASERPSAAVTAQWLDSLETSRFSLGSSVT